MGITWQDHEDTLLMQTVLDFCNKGASIAEAFTRASKKLQRTSEACSSRWYEKFQEMYKNEIKSIKTTVKRTNDYVGEWKWYEDEKFMNLMVQYLIEGVGTTEAIVLCSKELSRSPKSCSTHWYKHISKRNKLTIENMIAKGKEKMTSITVARNWSKDDENIAYSMMRNLIAQGVINDIAWEKVSNRINIKLSQVRNYWYSYLYPENKKEIDELRRNNSGNYTKRVDDWSEDKKYELFKIITSGKEAGKTITHLCNYASTILGNPQNECQNMWYNYVRKDESFIKRYQEASNKEILEILEIIETKNNNDWTKDQITLLKDTIIQYAKQGRTLTPAFTIVSVSIAKTVKEIAQYWDTYLKYELASELRKINETRKNGEVVETPKQEVKQPVIEKVVIETQTRVDTSKVDDFTQLIQKVIHKNKTLQEENNKLQIALSKVEAEAAIANDFKKKYEELMSAMERARQFILESEVEIDTKISNK